MSSRKSGKRKNELEQMFNDAEYSVTQILENFSHNGSPLPDLVAGDGDIFYAIDAYASGRKRVYIQREDVQRIENFSALFGAEPRIGIKFDRENWRFFSPEELHMTDNGNYRIKKDNRDKGESFYDLIGL